MLKSVIAAAAVALAAAAAPPAAAEVVSRHADGFTLRYATGAEVGRDEIPGALAEIGTWWNGDHSYSGAASNITLDLRPGGCWCEALGEGRVFEHARIVEIGADRVFLNAPLGPLNGKATRADLTIEGRPDNRGTEIVWEFVVEGPGLGALADAVDAVMDEAFDRYVHFLEYGEAPAAAPPTPTS